MEPQTKLIALKTKLAIDGCCEFALAGCCMEPLLFEGDAIKVARTDDFVVGAIYGYVSPDGNLYAHRLVVKHDDELALKGDRSNRQEVVGCSTVLGRVAHVKLQGSDRWCPMASNDCIAKISAFLSRNMYHGPEKSACKIVLNAERLKRRLCRHCLMAINRRVRNRLIRQSGFDGAG